MKIFGVVVFVQGIFDFKGDVQLGKGQVTTSGVDMKRYGKFSLFNLTLEYRNSVDEGLQRFYVDVVSDSKDHDAYACIHHLRYICRHVPFAKQLFQTKKHLEWSYDCASGNVNHEMTRELLLEYSKMFPNLETTSICPFEQCHGHEIADEHFSTVDKMLLIPVSVKKTGPHKTSIEAMHGLNRGREIINARNAKEGKPKVHMVAVKNNLRTGRGAKKKNLGNRRYSFVFVVRSFSLRKLDTCVHSLKCLFGTYDFLRKKVKFSYFQA